LYPPGFSLHLVSKRLQFRAANEDIRSAHCQFSAKRQQSVVEALDCFLNNIAQIYMFILNFDSVKLRPTFKQFAVYIKTNSSLIFSTTHRSSASAFGND
jgi:hypothetical protein